MTIKEIMKALGKEDVRVFNSNTGEVYTSDDITVSKEGVIWIDISEPYSAP